MGRIKIEIDRLEFCELEQRINRDPYRKLFWAVLERAVRDYQNSQRKIVVGENRLSQLDKREARLWFERDNQAFLSFSWICEELELDPEVIRKFIKEVRYFPAKGPKSLADRVSKRGSR